MKLSELLSETAKIDGRSQSEALGKKFGSIYIFNQMATVQRQGTLVSVSMIIGGVTDMISKDGKRQPVAYHKVSLAFNNIEHEYYKPSALVETIRLKYEEYADTEKYKSADILKIAIENPTKFFPGSTLFRATNDSDRGFCVVPNQIPEDADVKVWCSCSDYYWTMQYYNCENNVDLNGQYPERYIPKTKKGFEAFKSGQPLRNPGRHPGMCKHLMLLLATLIKKDVVKDISDKEGTSIAQYYEANFSNFIDKKKQRISMTEYKNKIAEYKRDHEIKRVQRKLYHDTSYGAGGHNAGWGYKWDPKSGQFKKKR